MALQYNDTNTKTYAGVAVNIKAISVVFFPSNGN